MLNNAVNISQAVDNYRTIKAPVPKVFMLGPRNGLFYVSPTGTMVSAGLQQIRGLVDKDKDVPGLMAMPPTSWLLRSVHKHMAAKSGAPHLTREQLRPEVRAAYAVALTAGPRARFTPIITRADVEVLAPHIRRYIAEGVPIGDWVHPRIWTLFRQL